MESLSRYSNGFHDVELHRHREGNADPIVPAPRIVGGLLGFQPKVSGKSHADTTANSSLNTWAVTATVASGSHAGSGGVPGIR
jgi:hypothetical protein